MIWNSVAGKSDTTSPAASRNAHRTGFPIQKYGTTRAYSPREEGSTVGSIRSVGRALHTPSSSSAGWTWEPGQNAISTLLEPPILQPQRLPLASAPALNAHKPPTAGTIPPVALANIANIEVAEFNPYLTRVGTLLEELRRRREEAADILHRRSGETEEFGASSHNGYLRPEQQSSTSREYSTSSVFTLSQVGTSASARRPSSGGGSRAAQRSSRLSTIPPVYFEDNFHLENPRTFDVVSERSEVVRPLRSKLDTTAAADGNAGPPRKALATNAVLQEKISWYMDTIELGLAAFISEASITFFTALSSLLELHAETIDSVERMKGLRKELQTLDETFASAGLDIIRKRQRRQNIQQLHDAVLQLEHIIEGTATCESFVGNGEVEKALESIEALERLIAGKPDPSNSSIRIHGRDLQLRDLRDLTALQGFSDSVTTLRFRTGRVYETRFLDLLLGDLRCHSDGFSAHEVLTRWSTAAARSRGGHVPDSSLFPSNMNSTSDLRSTLLAILTGLHRAKHLTAAAAAYREASLKAIRSLVRQPLPSSNDDDDDSAMSSSTTGSRQLSRQQKSSILARNLRGLQPQDAEEILVKIYISVIEMLRRLKTQVKLLLDVATSLRDDYGPSGPGSLQMEPPLASPTATRSFITAIELQEIHKVIDQPNLLGEAVDLAQDNVVKLLLVRSEQNAHLSATRFLRYFALNLDFAHECELISGRSGAILKTVVNGQIKDFIQQHANAAKQWLTRVMESDKWDAKDFAEKDTSELNRILSCSASGPAEGPDGLQIWIPHSVDDPGSIGHDETQPSGDGKARVRNASIDEEIFVLPYSAIVCMYGLSDFLRLMTGIPSMTSDIGASLVSYLRLFSSSCEQLILGAGARQSAGLRNITSKHLVLASQALAFVATIISRVCEFVRYSAGGGAADPSVEELDLVKHLYREQQHKIYNKLVDIMSGLVNSHVKTMRNIDWDNSQANVHSYMGTLTKDTTSLSRILTKNLPEATVHMVMRLVFINYKDRLGQVFEELHPKSELGRASMLHDIEYFESKLGSIDGYGDTGEYLTSIINSKQV